MRTPFRRPARHLNIHQRHRSLKSQEQVICRRIIKLFRVVSNGLVIHMQFLGRETFRTSQIFKFGGTLLCLLIYSFMVVLTDRNEERDLIERLNMLNKQRTIGSFSDASCWNFFETDKSDLPRLMAALRIPDRVVLDIGSVKPGEEILLRGLYELVSGEDRGQCFWTRSIATVKLSIGSLTTSMTLSTILSLTILIGGIVMVIYTNQKRP
jgi:hypothetical protein